MATAATSQPNEAEKVLSDVGEFFKKLFSDLSKAKQIFDALSPEVKTVLVPIFQAAVDEAKNIGSGVAADGLNVALDVEIGTALVAIVRQAKAGVKSIEADFASLGIKL